MDNEMIGSTKCSKCGEDWITGHRCMRKGAKQMNIIEAFRVCKKVSGNKVRSYGDTFWEIGRHGFIVNQDGETIKLHDSNLFADDYEIYEEVIRPKEVNEVWQNRNGDYAVTVKMSNRLVLISDKGYSEVSKIELEGWERIHPPVEDGERVEIDDVYINKHLIIMKASGVDGIEELVNKLGGKSGKLIFITNKGEK